MSEPQTRQVSCFRSAKLSGFAVKSMKLGEVLPAIVRSEKLRLLTEALRQEPDEDTLQELKRSSFPAITPSARFGYGTTDKGERKWGVRREESEWTHSGAIALDLDDDEKEIPLVSLDPAAVRDAAGAVAGKAGKSYTIASYVSPTGKGVKVIVHVSPLPRSVEEHAKAFDAARAFYMKELKLYGPGGEYIAADQYDVTRLCFLAHDKDAILRPARETYALRWE